jgi:ribose 5-phosphate isomerase RpiB
MDPELLNKIVQEVKNSLQHDGQLINTSASPVGTVPDERLLKKIFITADDLSARLNENSSSSVELASNEYLTPAAADLAARRKIGITRKPDPLTRPVAKPALPGISIPTFKDVPLSASRISQGTGPVGLITYFPDEKTDSALRALAHDGIFFTDRTDDECWMVNLINLCRGINDGSLALGIVLFPFGADALIMANKVPGIRAVQGTAVESVAASVRRLSTNVLVLEHRRSTFHELRAMIRIFVQNRMVSGIAQDVLDRIKELEK